MLGAVCNGDFVQNGTYWKLWCHLCWHTNLPVISQCSVYILLFHCFSEIKEDIENTLWDSATFNYWTRFQSNLEVIKWIHPDNSIKLTPQHSNFRCLNYKTVVFDQRRLLLWMIYYKVSEDIRKILPQLSMVLEQQYSTHSIYIRTLSSFSFGRFISFKTCLGRNQIYSACCSVQMAHKPV